MASNPTSPPTSSALPIAPECTVHLVDFESNPATEDALVSDRTDPSTNAGFTHFRRLGGPIGNPARGFPPDVYGFNEVWFRTDPPVVFRAQAHPGFRSQFQDFKGSAWTITAENAAGKWTIPFLFGSANSGQEEDDPVAGGVTTPQFTPVGDKTKEMFACAGMRSDDGAIRTTSLFELMTPSFASGPMPGPSKPIIIQDLLSGDDHFQTTTSNPLSGTGHITAPTPNIKGPGNPITQGTVQCAMTQPGDDVTMRELHMLAVSGGHLYYANASNWSTATQFNGIPFQRFNTISQWSDVNTLLGGGFNNIVAATIVASRPQAVSVLFAAQTPNGNFKLIHAVRFSAGGTWRTPDDVFALNGATSPGPTSGLGKSFQVAAGLCPAYQPPTPTQDQELVYVLWTADRDIFMGSNVATARQWSPQLTGNYSPLFDISKLLAGTSDPSRMDTINSMSVSARPFRDDATLPP